MFVWLWKPRNKTKTCRNCWSLFWGFLTSLCKYSLWEFCPLQGPTLFLKLSLLTSQRSSLGTLFCQTLTSWLTPTGFSLERNHLAVSPSSLDSIGHNVYLSFPFHVDSISAIAILSPGSWTTAFPHSHHLLPNQFIVSWTNNPQTLPLWCNFLT